MAEQEDWRLAFAKLLRGQSFRWKTCYQRSDEWDHDHCAACWVRFSTRTDDPESQQAGYAVTEDYSHGADYEWVCKKCFDDLQTTLDWKIAD